MSYCDLCGKLFKLPPKRCVYFRFRKRFSEADVKKLQEKTLCVRCIGRFNSSKVKKADATINQMFARLKSRG